MQRLLLRSTSARLLAVRRVTQDNQGKRTPGVDGLASLEPEERCQLVRTLSLAEPARPVRRIWIPKPGTQEQPVRRTAGGGRIAQEANAPGKAGG